MESNVLNLFSRLQKALSSIILNSVNDYRGSKRDFEYVVGLDISYSRKYGGVAVAVLVNATLGKMIDYTVAIGEPPIPYVPGFLAFREAPLMYAAYTYLTRRHPVRIDCVIVDGHGIAHPRFAGIASHIGAAIKRPSIGVAKKKLVGETVVEDGVEYLIYKGVKVAIVVKSRGGKKLYVSPGYGIGLKTAASIVSKLLGDHPLPLPTYLADKLSRRIAKSLDKGDLTPSLVARGQLPMTLDDFLY